MNKSTLAMKKNIRLFLIVGISCFSLLGYSQNPNSLENEIYKPTEPACIYTVGEYKGQISIPRSQTLKDKMSKARGSAPCATILVNYSTFSPEAQAAFQFAIDIWAASLESSQEIRVSASFEPLGVNTLGSAGANGYTTLNPNTAPGALPNVFYPIALAEKLSGTNLNSTIEPDINARFNSDFDWYYGLDANPPRDKIDFVSVVLHELGHGLGFVGFGSVTGLSGSVRLGTASLPSVYDNFTENGAGVALLTFEDPSSALGIELTSNDLYCNSETAQAQIGNTRPQIWAPTPFSGGSSYSHWDENVFEGGDINSLMTPSIGRGQANHNPGPITLGFFKDMGWSLCEPLLTVEDLSIETVELSPNPFTSSITIKVANNQSDDYNLTLIDINGRVVLSETKAVLNGTMTISNLDALEAALYFVKITNQRNGARVTKKIIKN